ncbi:hypothetical protein B0T10DRAFT_574266 [Thelonectria olida]|uniref:Uncharacterized protein n=1 Tax=Thelonectria olida TaxID=1576542 RepID=A0A9P9AG47_9HYPO|nr:hypothetical protein B0T10DRAFT_574266 [Thelonectria olida]
MQPHAKDLGIAWKPSWKHAPWIAFASILGFVVCCVALAAILFTSDGEDVTAWPYPSRTIPVSVLLSLAVTASSVSITEFGPSSVGANVDVSNASFPASFSSVSGVGSGPQFLTPLFSNVSRAYANRDDIALPIEGRKTNSTCVLTLPAPGFDVSCAEKLLPYDFSKLAAAGSGNQAAIPPGSGFGKDSDTINTTFMYKPKATRDGQVIQRECVLRLATVGYPITVSDSVVTLKRWQLGQNETLELAQSLSGDINSIYVTGSSDNTQTMFGGIFYVLNAHYTSFTVLSLGGNTNVPFILNATGQAASNYLNSDISTYNNWTMTWEDPTADIVNTARELMLRSAIAYSDYNRTAVVPQELSDYEYLAITLGCMVPQALIIAFLLLGWRRLGREVSLDAFEVARALGAPLLQGGSSNSDIQKALSPLRREKLRYGEVASVVDQVQTGNHEARDAAQQRYGKARSFEGAQLIGSEAGYELQSHGGERPKLGLGLERQIRDLRHGVLY